MANERATKTHVGLARLVSLDFFFGRVLNGDKGWLERETPEIHCETTNGNRSGSVSCGLDGGGNLGWLVLGLGNGGGGGLLRHYAVGEEELRGREGGGRVGETDAYGY